MKLKHHLILSFFLISSLETLRATDHKLSEDESLKITTWNIHETLNQSVKTYYDELSKQEISIPPKNISLKLCDLNTKISQEEEHLNVLKDEIAYIQKIRKKIQKKRPDDEDYMFHLKLILSGTTYESSTQLRKAYTKTLITFQSQKEKEQLVLKLQDQLTAENILQYMKSAAPDFIKKLTEEQALIHLKQML